MRTIAKVPLRRGEVDTEFDQEMLAELLDQLPFNLAVADLYKTRFNGVPGVVYAAGVRHAYNVAEAFRDLGLKAQAVSGETPKRELAQILARYERGDIDVLVNAQLLAEGWNSPRATVCMHLAPTASKRIYQQRVGRVTRRHPGKEAGIVVDFVHPATKHDDPVVTLHSLLDREVYRGGAIVVGPVRRGRGRRLRVERRVLPVTADENRRIEVFERELWRIAVEHLDYGEQVQWAALAGARVAPAGWRRARAMLHFDQGGELKRTFLITAVERNKNAQLRLRALQEIAASRDAEAFDRALDFVESWPRDEKREGVKVVLQALAEKQIGRRDQANNWIWRCANMTREVHEEYAVQRWPETKRLLGLLVNSSGGAHARNARRLVHAARQQDRRLSAALLAAAIPHTAEAGEVVNGARTRMSRKPAALARELLRNFPKGKGRRGTRRRKKKGAPDGVAPEVAVAPEVTAALEEAVDAVRSCRRRPAPRRCSPRPPPSRRRHSASSRRRRRSSRPRRRSTRKAAGADAALAKRKPAKRRSTRKTAAPDEAVAANETAAPDDTAAGREDGGGPRRYGCAERSGGGRDGGRRPPPADAPEGAQARRAAAPRTRPPRRRRSPPRASAPPRNRRPRPRPKPKAKPRAKAKPKAKPGPAPPRAAGDGAAAAKPRRAAGRRRRPRPAAGSGQEAGRPRAVTTQRPPSPRVAAAPRSRRPTSRDPPPKRTTTRRRTVKAPEAA